MTVGQRRQQVLVGRRQPRRHAIGVAPIPEAVGRQDQVLRQDALDRRRHLGRARRGRLERRRCIGHLARQLALQVVADVDAVVGQEQLVRGAIRLETPPQQLHEVQLADDALERRPLDADEGQRRARQRVGPDRVALFDGEPGHQHAKAAMREHRAADRRGEVAAEHDDVVEAGRHAPSLAYGSW